jgi:fumarate reductase subunit D
MSSTRKPAEPVLWLLFSGGGVLAALVVPILLFLFGVAFPLGWLDAPDWAHLAAVSRNLITRLALLAVFVAALFHAAHRLRYTVYDGLQLRRLGAAIDLVCYGGAFVGSAVAAFLVLLVV